MALTDAFLATCRTAITALPELTAFRAARTPMTTGTTRATRLAAWQATFTPPGSSPQYLLRVAMRSAIQSRATGAQGPLDLEAAYRTLEAEFSPDASRPLSDTEVKAIVDTLF